MRNFFKEIWKDYWQAQRELKDMGIIQFNLPIHGSYVWVDKEHLQTYQERLREKMVEGDQSPTK